MKWIAGIPNEWRCVCLNAQWSCAVTAGGFSILECPGYVDPSDAGDDAAAEASVATDASKDQ
jgi:hypothetical protein